jgi:SAM-dependent methyltransferase
VTEHGDMTTTAAAATATTAAAVGPAADARGPAAPAAVRHAPAGGATVTICFAAATFLGAFLLFLVQPLIAKYILPWFGGGAAVWTTCVLFFQATLLGGYLYAHLGVKRLGTRGQAVLHGALLLAAAAAALPAIVPSERWKLAGPTTNPTGQILMLLLATVGLPCLALAATSPILHAWYSRIRPGAAVYRLYALSNLGSLLALLAYPLLMEPMLSRRTQALLWSAYMVAFAVLCGACAMLAARYVPRSSADAGPGRDGHVDGDADGATEPPPVPAAPLTAAEAVAFADLPARRVVKPLPRSVQLALWLLLPACATSLLLATTNAITQDFAPIPFLWVLPLALYLVTFIIAFDRPAWYSRRVFGVILAVLAAAAAWSLSDEGVLRARVGVAALTAAMFAGCMVLHGELARVRPPTARLTTYYLCIAAGGALGGLLVAVGAPLLLRSYAEFQISLWVACLLAFVLPMVAERRPPGPILGFLAPVGLLVLGLGLWITPSGYGREGKELTRTRDYYGVLSVWEIDHPDGKGRVLYHGTTTHGHQFTRRDRRALPTTYYYPGSGIDRLLGKRSPVPTPRRVAVVGLGTGTIAAYAQSGDVYRYYEISPSVQDVARTYFSYLGDAEERGATVDVVIGDARLSMEREADQRYDVIALDAFSGDAVPVHLLTLEAFQLYTRHLAPDGVMAVHTSNRYLNLQDVVAAAAKQLGWDYAMLQAPDGRNMGYSSTWVMMSPDPARIDHFERLGSRGGTKQRRTIDPWTDEHANVLGILQ